MILSCPACATRYRVDEQEFEGSVGRTVRCANCGHLWYEAHPTPPMPNAGQRAETSVTRLASAADPAAPEAAPVAVPQLEIPTHAPARSPRARSSAWGIIRAVALFGAVVIGAIFFYYHSAIDPHAALPPQAALDRPAATPPQQPGTGLAIRNITPERTPAGLIVNGEIVNSGSIARDVPRLRVVLQDSRGKEVQFKTVDPPKARVQPGEVVRFETPFADPTDAATGVVVTFASS
jgi:predicted Zn finger-like uncharacterized protein